MRSKSTFASNLLFSSFSISKYTRANQCLKKTVDCTVSSIKLLSLTLKQAFFWGGFGMVSKMVSGWVQKPIISSHPANGMVIKSHNCVVKTVISS